MAVLGDAMGSAWVNIRPDMSGFGADLLAKLKAETTGVKANVKVGAEADKASIAATIAQIQAALKAIPKGQAGLADLIDFNVPQGQIVSQLLMLKRMVQQTGLSDMLGVNLNDSQIRQQLEKLANLSADITIGADTGSAMTAVEKLRAQIAALGARASELLVSVDVNDTAAQAKITALMAQLSALGARAVKMPVDLDVNSASFLRAEAQALSVAAAMDKINTSVSQGLPLWTAGGGAWSFLTGKMQLFGGALTQLGIPAILGTATGLHLVIDAALELAGTLIPAAVAFTAFGAAAVPTVQDIVTQMQGLHTVTQALGTNIYPLTGGFQAIADAVQPQVYLLFGEGLDIINRKSGEFATLAQQAGTVLDGLGARFAAAITSGSTFSTIMQHAGADLAGWGTLIGNIGGIIGGVLKQLPGYAEVLLGILDSVSHAIEDVVNSGLGQWIIGAGLAFHGALLWLGLAATAAVYLGNGLVSLAAKFGLAEAGALSFDAVQFGTGIKLMGSYAADAAVAIGTMAGAEDVAAASTGVWEAALIALDAVNPLVWVGLAAAALGGLIYWLTQATSATQSYDNAVNAALGNAPVSQLGIDLTRQMAATTGLLNTAQRNLGATQEYVSGVNLHTGQTIQMTNAAYTAQLAVVQGYQGELSTLQGYQANYNELVKAAGGNLGLLTEAGITSNQIIGASSSQMAQYVIEVQAAGDALQAMSLGAGRNAAAMNALNFAAGASSNALGQADASMAKVVQAQQQLMTVITGGQESFDTFEQGLYTLAYNFNQVTGSTATTSFTLGHIKDSASLAGASLAGTSQASYALNQAFYSQIDSAQKLIGSLEMQNISTASLKTIVGTTAGQMLGFAGTNTEARSVIVDLINNALGPGTVSLKNLNSWVAQNSTTMSGLNADIATATIQAGTLAGTLQQDLNNQFRQFLLQASGADTALKIYTGDLVHNQTSTSQGRQDRLNLIADLENAGLSAQQAAAYVDGLSRSLGKVPPVTRADLAETATGTYKIVAGSVAVQGGGSLVQGGAAHGMYLHPNTGTPGRDSVLIAAMPGELVVPANLVPQVAPVLTGKIPGFASGGFVSSADTLPELAPATDAFHAAFVNTVTGALEKATTAAALAAQQSAMFGLTGPGIQAGSAVLAYASQFAGKVPYVWGGDTPAGWDCSGFVSYVYDKFGIYNGRTTAAGLQEWGRTAGPVPGGMVFFGFPAHHVGFVVNDSTMLSALGTQWGTTYSSSAGNSGFEVPPQWAAQSTTMPGGVGWVPGNPQSGSAAAAEDFARSILWAFGWGQNEWPSLYDLWNRESGWNAWAQNPTSGAAGIPQNIAGWSAYAPGDYANQVRWGLAYISGRYGSPDAAWAHELAQGWYAQGGIVPGSANPRGFPTGQPGQSGGPALTPSQSWMANAFAAWPHGYGNWSTGPWWGQALTAQQQEQADYAHIQAGFRASLAKAKKGTWEYSRRTEIEHELRTLAARQSAEETAFKALGTPGSVLTAAGLQRLTAAAKAEAPAIRNADLIRGHPALMAGLWHELGLVAQAAGTHISQGVTPWPSFFQNVPLPKKGTQQYATLSGVYGFDRGGYLPPGISLAVNATGRPELVSPVPPGAAAGSSDSQQIIGLLRMITRQNQQLINIATGSPAAYASALNGVAATSAARGYYSGMR